MTPEFKSIPTFYNGIRFRSRLEAKWAAFFDHLNLRWEYEPCDLEGWTPDFALIGGHGTLYVEVKPIEWTNHVDANVSLVRKREDIKKCDAFLLEDPERSVLILGSAPVYHFCIDHYLYGDPGPQDDAIGVLYTTVGRSVEIEGSPVDENGCGQYEEVRELDFHSAVLASNSRGAYDIWPGSGAWVGLLSDEGRNSSGGFDFVWADAIKPIWKAACNAVQWQGRRTA